LLLLLRGHPESGSPSPCRPDSGWGDHSSIDQVTQREHVTQSPKSVTPPAVQIRATTRQFA
jgi:hypothetical protein